MPFSRGPVVFNGVIDLLPKLVIILQRKGAVCIIVRRRRWDERGAHDIVHLDRHRIHSVNWQFKSFYFSIDR